MKEKEIKEFVEKCDLRCLYDWYLKDISQYDFHNKVPFPTGRRLRYGCYSYFVDTDFVMSDKPDRVFNISRIKEDGGDTDGDLHKFNVENGFQVSVEGGWKTKDRLDGNYYEYETTFDKELTICQLLVKSDFVVRRSGDCQHYGFNSWELLEDGVTLDICVDS